MKFLITGGTGNIGSFLIEEILSKGYSVNYLTRNQIKIKKSSNLNGFFWDIDKQIIDYKCFEGVSRAMFKFNHVLDKAIFKPVAKGYRALPSPIRKGTGNAVDNLRSLLTLSTLECS